MNYHGSKKSGINGSKRTGLRILSTALSPGIRGRFLKEADSIKKRLRSRKDLSIIVLLLIFCGITIGIQLEIDESGSFTLRGVPSERPGSTSSWQNVQYNQSFTIIAN